MPSAITLNNLRRGAARVSDGGSAERGAGRGRDVPDDDDDEVEQVPAAAYVGAGVHDQTVGQDFSEGLDGEDDEEDVLHLFLGTDKRGVEVRRDKRGRLGGVFDGLPTSICSLDHVRHQ